MCVMYFLSLHSLRYALLTTVLYALHNPAPCTLIVTNSCPLHSDLHASCPLIYSVCTPDPHTLSRDIAHCIMETMIKLYLL